MRKLFISFIVVVWAANANAQLFVPDVRNSQDKRPVDTCLLKVKYKFHYYYDVTKKTRLFDRQILEVGKNISHFYSATSEEVDSTMYRARQDKMNRYDDGVKLRQNLAQLENGTYEDIVFNTGEKNLAHRIRLVNRDYQYTEPSPKIEWIIGFEGREILGYKCQKATATFGKRKWIAWFTTEIPVQMGPYKFQGLPGLILSIKDEDSWFEYECTGIEQPKQASIYQYFPKKAVVNITKKEMVRLLTMRWDDPVSLYSAHGVRLVGGGDKAGKTIELKSGSIKKPYIPTIELE